MTEEFSKSRASSWTAKHRADVLVPCFDSIMALRRAANVVIFHGVSGRNDVYTARKSALRLAIVLNRACQLPQPSSSI